jgi:two-component system cell cycle sensor histidine kinase/response regulator CckA
MQVNPAWCRMLGYSSDELLTLTIDEVTHPDDRTTSHDLLSKLYSGNIQFFDLDKRYLRKDGTIAWGHVTCTAVRDENGKPLFLIALIQDIKDRKRAEQALRQSEINFSSFFNTVDEFLFVIDQRGKILKVNQTVLRRLGYSEQELINQSIVTIHPLDVRDEAISFAHGILAGETQYSSLPFKAKNDQLISVETHVVPGKWNDQDVFFAVSKDISEIKQSEEKFSKVFNANPSLMAISTVDTGLFLDVNDSFLQTLGYSREEIVGKSSTDLHLFHDISQRNEVIKQVHENGFARNHDVIIRKKDGQLTYGLFSAEIIQIQNVPHLLTVMNNCTDRINAEQALRESEKRLTDLVDFLPDATFAIDKQGKIIVWNRAMEEMTGSKAEDMIGKGDYEYAIPFYGSRRPILIDLALDFSEETKDKYVFVDVVYEGLLAEAHVPLKGVYHYLSGKASPLYNNKGEIVGAIESIRDITDRKMAEEAVLREKKLVETLFNSLPGYAFFKDASGTYITANKSFCESIKKPLEELIGKRDVDIFPPHVAEIHRYDDQIALNSGSSMTSGEIQIENHNKLVTISTHKVPVKDEAGNTIGLIGLGFDVSELKQTQDDLERSLSLVRATLESTADGILVVDQQGNIAGYNQKFIELWKVPISLVMEKNDLNLITFVLDQLVYPDQFLSRIETLYANPMMESHDLLEFKDGRWFERYSLPQRLGNDIIGRVWSFRDITESKQYEAQQHRLEEQIRLSQKLETIGTLASGIAHDFNNLLVPVIGYTELTQSDLPPDNPSRELLDEVLKAAYRAKALVGQVLTFSRQQSGQRKPVRFESIIQEAVKLLRSTIDPKIEILVSLASDLPVIMADPTQLHQIIMNLCVNSSHALSNGGKINIELRNTFEGELRCHNCLNDIPGRHVYMKVSDNGSGMSQSILSRIFDPFFTTKPAGKGSGLGLAVTHGIVAQHHGHICVNSAEGVGTAFHIYLPVNETSEMKIIEESEIIQGKGEKILFVDDDPFVIGSIERTLNHLGYSVTSFQSPSAALNSFQSENQNYDLVITDLRMPEMNGCQLAQQITAQNPNLPIIMCTGYADLLDSQALTCFGVREVIIKPVTTVFLSQVIHRVLASVSQPQVV